MHIKANIIIQKFESFLKASEVGSGPIRVKIIFERRKPKIGS